MSDEQDSQQNPTPKRRARVWYKAFLGVLSETANVRLAAEAAQVNRTTVYSARDRDPEFAAQWDHAIEDATDRLLEVATIRATEGWEEPVYQQGEMIGTVRKFDNTLLWKLMGAHQPATYGNKVQQDVTSGGKPVSVHLYLPANGREGTAEYAPGETDPHRE